MDYADILTARAPVIANPALVKRRTLHLERVTMLPGRPGRPARRAPDASPPARRAATGALALVIIAGMPLAHASAPDPAQLDAVIPALHSAEPMLALFEPPPTFAPRPLPRRVLTARDEPVKVDGVRPSPYAQPAPGIVRRPPRVRPAAHDEPEKVSDLKANPYE